ncbi:MAG: glycosyltransferase family 2 protein [Propioniciclava sp.]
MPRLAERGQDPSPTVVASVVVPSFQGAHRLGPLLEALLAQEPGFIWELIVVVDGSTDNTQQLLSSYQEKLPIRILSHTEPQGAAAALMTGFAAAQGTYLIRCDDDLSPRPDFLRSHVAAHEGRSDRAVIGLTRDVFPATRYADVYGTPANRRARDAAYSRPVRQRWMHWAANNSLHRDTWAAHGGFNPHFAYGEDYELGYRLAQAGLEFIIAPELELDHRGPATSCATRVPRAFVSGAAQRMFSAVHPRAHMSSVQPNTAKARVWSVAVRSLAAVVRSPQHYARLGSWADRLIIVLPAPVAARLVAYLVEAAGASGRSFGSDDLTVYRGQKQAELTRERRLAGRYRTGTVPGDEGPLGQSRHRRCQAPRTSSASKERR